MLHIQESQAVDVTAESVPGQLPAPSGLVPLYLCTAVDTS